jgi:hypothetical protein
MSLPSLCCHFHTLFSVLSSWSRPHLLCPEEVLPRCNSHCTLQIPQFIGSLCVLARPRGTPFAESIRSEGTLYGHEHGTQPASLEEPTQEETDVISVDASGTKMEVEAEALRRVRDIAGKGEFVAS